MSNILRRTLNEFRYYSPPKEKWTLKAVGEFWDSVFNYDEINKEANSYFRRFTDALKLCSLPDKSYVLDICSRTGNGSVYFYRNNKISKVVCADVSSKFQEICHERLTKNHVPHELCFFDEYRLPFKDEEFDGVLCFETIEHFAQPEVFLKELHRVLKNGGELVLTTPNVLWEPAHWLAAILNVHHSEGPHKFVRKRKLRKFLEASDFKILKQDITVIIPAGPEFLIKSGEWLEKKLKKSLMPLLGLRNILICIKE